MRIKLYIYDLNSYIFTEKGCFFNGIYRFKRFINQCDIYPISLQNQ